MSAVNVVKSVCVEPACGTMVYWRGCSLEQFRADPAKHHCLSCGGTVAFTSNRHFTLAPEVERVGLTESEWRASDEVLRIALESHALGG